MKDKSDTIFIISYAIVKATLFLIGLWHLIQLGISVEKLHVKLQAIQYCISRPVEKYIDDDGADDK